MDSDSLDPDDAEEEERGEWFPELRLSSSITPPAPWPPIRR
jgi:hypothetical protein